MDSNNDETALPSDPATPEFWSSRYAAAKMPWDLRGVSARLESFLHGAASGGRVLIPGCGSGYEIRAFHDAGWDVTAIDFAPAAVERARAVLGPLASKVQLGDFFAHDFRDRFDLVYERTFLCALAPARWPDYAARIAELLQAGGRLAGIFLYGNASDGPPFPLPEGRDKELLGERFQLALTERLPPSLPVFEGMEERWQEWSLKV